MTFVPGVAVSVEERIVADRKGGVPPPPTTSTIRAEDVDGATLARRRHDAVLFVGIDLSERKFVGAAFSDCTFRSVRFNASTFRDGAFTNCTFADCSFFDVRFIECKLVGSLFDRCRFEILIVEGGDWSLVGAPGADLRTASFRDVRMREADLTGAQFDGATMRDVDLAGAWLHNASFAGADLRGSDLSALDPLNASIKDALIDVEGAMVIATNLGFRIG